MPKKAPTLSTDDVLKAAGLNPDGTPIEGFEAPVLTEAPVAEDKPAEVVTEAPVAEDKPVPSSKIDKPRMSAEELASHLKATLQKRFKRDLEQLHVLYLCGAKVEKQFETDFASIFTEVDQKVWYYAYDFYFRLAVARSLSAAHDAAMAWRADQIKAWGSNGPTYFTEYYDTPSVELVAKEEKRAADAGEDPKKVHGWVSFNLFKAADLLDEFSAVLKDDVKFTWKAKGQSVKDWQVDVISIKWTSTQKTIKALRDLTKRGKCKYEGCRCWTKAYRHEESGEIRVNGYCQTHFEKMNFKGSFGRRTVGGMKHKGK